MYIVDSVVQDKCQNLSHSFCCHPHLFWLKRIFPKYKSSYTLVRKICNTFIPCYLILTAGSGEPGRGLSSGDFERWMKGAVNVSLGRGLVWRASGEGSFTGDPGRYVEKGSGYGHLPPLGNLEGICLLGLLRE